MIHFILRESDEAEYAKEAREHLSDFRRKTPDDIYFVDDQSITFIYDQHNNKLYHQKYPATHGSMLEEDQIGYDLGITPSIRYGTIDRDEALNAGYVLGRIGKLESQDRYERGHYRVISFWGEKIDLKPEDVKSCLQEIVKAYPVLAKERENVIVTSAKAFAPYVLVDAQIDFSSGAAAGNSEDKIRKANPECQDVKIKVDGEQMSLGTFIGNLHNVRGDRLQKMHGAYCGAVQSLRKSLSQEKCPHEVELLNHIDTRFKQLKMPSCSADWDEILQKGKTTYRQELKGKFQKAADAARSGDDSDPLGSEFRTQRELDAAWDYTRKREHAFPTFTEWMAYLGRKR